MPRDFDPVFEARVVRWERRLERILIEMDADTTQRGVQYPKDFRKINVSFNRAIGRMRRHRVAADIDPKVE